MTKDGGASLKLAKLREQRSVYFQDHDPLLNNDDELSNKMFVDVKLRQDRQYEKLPEYLQNKLDTAAAANGKRRSTLKKVEEHMQKRRHIDDTVIEAGDKTTVQYLRDTSEDLAVSKTEETLDLVRTTERSNETRELPSFLSTSGSRSLELFQQNKEENLLAAQPEWHAPWKLMHVMAGHTGWVRSLAMDVENEWFASGAADRTIKVWDLSSSKLKLTLAGHIMAVRGIALSPRHPYMFSCSEDKTVKCWDLEKNKIIRDYHGHLSSVYTIDIHPTIDVIATGGRDSSVRLWDIRTRVPIHVLTGHSLSVTNVKCQGSTPQLMSTSMDGTIRTYDIVAGRTRQVLTHHAKAVRGLAVHSVENTFASASSDNIKQWKLPDCQFLQNFTPRHEGIVNTLSISDSSNVLFSGADDGSMSFFDWKTGHKFQATKSVNMPGSLDSERAIYCSTFDRSGSRLITGEADKSIKIWKEDPDATPETHPGIPWLAANNVQRDAL